ncbi:MAG TPA: DUF4157 domain-containing protein [Symbiobacteriaceae bacterium]|nr:DUF4157 domain-containing protein [Symbiobacteriaceae bacterium]
MRINTLVLKVGLTVGEPAQEQTSRTAQQTPNRNGAQPPTALDYSSGLPPAVLSEIARGLAGGTGLPADVLAWARASYGVDLSDVQVIADDRSLRLNEAAGTMGLAVGDGQILLRDPADETTLYHEAAHMAQVATGDQRSRQQREADAERAELVFARRAAPTNHTLPSTFGNGIDIRTLADHVYRLLIDQLQAEQQRRF